MLRGGYDVLILGSGISGSALALPLSRVGLSVLVLDKSSHPRFAIGEAMVPTTTSGFERIAKKYRIPEFHQLFNYAGLKEAGCAAYPKTHFFFGVQREGEPLAQHEQAMFETLELPVGPDVHMLRADVDAYLVSRYAHYGVDYAERTTLEGFRVGPRDVECTLAAPSGMTTVRAKLILDTSGPGSAVARQLGLRKADPDMKTHTRAIFGHFENVGRLEDVLGPLPSAFRYSRDAGTIHHCFRGGWVWVIPFDNGVVSVGVVLDPSVYPINAALAPEEEFREIVNRFPTISKQLEGMRAVRPVVRTGRVQFSSTSLVSPGVVLGPNTGGFVDALYSTGFSIIQAFVTRFVPVAARLLKDPSYETKRVPIEFRDLDRAYLSELKMIDSVVHGSIESFRSYDVFKQYWRIWTTASLIQFFTRLLGDPEDARGCGTLFGIGLGSWCQAVEDMNAVLESEHDDLEVARRMKAIMDAIPQPFPPHLTNYEVGSRDPCLVRLIDRMHADLWVTSLAKLPETREEMRLARMGPFIADVAKKGLALQAKYAWSRLRGGTYHRHIDFIRGYLLNGDHPPAGYLQHFRPAPWS